MDLTIAEEGANAALTRCVFLQKRPGRVAHETLSRVATRQGDTRNLKLVGEAVGLAGRFDDDGNPAIGVVVRSDQSRFAVPDSGDSLGIDAALHQSLLNGPRPALGELQVVQFRPFGVGVPFDADVGTRVLVKNTGYSIEFIVATWLEHGRVVVEKYFGAEM